MWYGPRGGTASPFEFKGYDDNEGVVTGDMSGITRVPLGDVYESDEEAKAAAAGHGEVL